MNRLLFALSLLLLAGCVARDSNRIPSGSRIDPSWIGRWGAELRTNPLVPPPPTLPPHVPPAPESPQAAMGILLSSEDARVNANWNVYHAAGKDGPYMVGLLHDMWFNEPQKRPYVATVYCALMSRGAGVGWAYEPDFDKSVAAECQRQILELFGGMLDHSLETRMGFLKISGFRLTYDVHPLFFERLERAPQEELPMWGSAIADFEKFPPEHSALAYDAIIAALEAAHAGRYPFDERGGCSPWFGIHLGNRIARNPSPEGARALAVLIRLRAEAMNDDLTWPLRSLDPEWPHTQDALAEALVRDRSELVIQALKMLGEYPKLRQRHIERATELANHYRPDIRSAAIAALPEDAPKPAPRPTFRLPREMIATLESLGPFSVVGGTRVKGRVKSFGVFDEDNVAEKTRLGWLLPPDPQGRYCFISFQAWSNGNAPRFSRSVVTVFLASGSVTPVHSCTSWTNAASRRRASPGATSVMKVVQRRAWKRVRISSSIFATSMTTMARAPTAASATA
jgi:hypothetical protein